LIRDKVDAVPAPVRMAVAAAPRTPETIA
jgi:hypothetical protein